LLQQRDITELAACSGTSFFRAHAAANALLGEQVEVHPHLFVEIEVSFLPAEEAAKLGRQNTHPHL
jgi:hypothetical protein